MHLCVLLYYEQSERLGNSHLFWLHDALEQNDDSISSQQMGTTQKNHPIFREVM